MEKSFGSRMDTLIKRCFRNRRKRSRLKFPNLWQERCRTFMSWSINIVCRDRRLIRRGGILLAFALAALAFAEDGNLHAPQRPVAGKPAEIGTEGSGSATLYLVGPSSAVKRDVELGKSISLSAKELQSAGRYIAV